MKMPLMPIITMMASLLLLTSCALFATGPGSTIAQARADHNHCLREGLHYPSDSYTACRRTQAELRQRETWSELQLMQQNDSIAPPPAMQRDRMSGYRPIREDNFYCYREMLENSSYIACRQTSPTQ